MTEEEDQGENPSVTMVNNNPLPTYSTERFYMLSEIEQNSSKISFLCDHECDGTAETESESEIDDCSLSSDILLYILWRPDMVASPKALTQGIIQQSVNQLKTMTEPRSTNIYLIVETIAPQQNDNIKESSQSEKLKEQQRLYQHQVEVAEDLVRCVTRHKTLRDDLQGLTVGICDHVRAAPGLEACMDAIVLGSRDRRMKGSLGGKSNIGLVTRHPDDLIGLADGETDAAQGVLQSITCCEWNGNGDLSTFAKRAHIRWCVNNKVELKGEERKPKVLSLRRRQRGLVRNDVWSDPITLFLSLLVATWLYVQILASYEDGFQEFRHQLESLFVSKKENTDEMNHQL